MKFALSRYLVKADARWQQVSTLLHQSACLGVCLSLFIVVPVGPGVKSPPLCILAKAKRQRRGTQKHGLGWRRVWECRLPCCSTTAKASSGAPNNY